MSKRRRFTAQAQGPLKCKLTAACQSRQLLSRKGHIGTIMLIGRSSSFAARRSYGVGLAEDTECQPNRFADRIDRQ